MAACRSEAPGLARCDGDPEHRSAQEAAAEPSSASRAASQISSTLSRR
jgi:hypothetical protein